MQGAAQNIIRTLAFLATGVFRVAAARRFWIKSSFFQLAWLSLIHGLGSPLRGADFAGSIVLGRPTASGITANILSPVTLQAYLEYGVKSGSYLAQTEPKLLPANQPVELDVSGLPTNSRIYYRLRYRVPAASSYEAAAENSFMTQRAPGSTFSFGVQGDSHPERVNTQFNAAFYNRTLATAAADNPDFYLTSGDDFSVDQINQANPAAVTNAQVVERYLIQRPYLGIIGKSAPVFLVNGNHEQAARYLLDGTPNNVAVWAQNARNAYYAQPAPDSFYSGNTEGVPAIGLLRNYYAWTWGDALFVTIDPYWGSPVVVDNDFFGGNKTADPWAITHGDAQYQWLKTTLETSKAKYKFIFAHHVMGTQRGGIDVAMKYEWGGLNNNGTAGFASRRPNWALPIHQLMVANKVTIFFQGHDHIWVHQQLDGVTYQSLGSPANPNYSLFNSDAYATGERFPDSGYTRVTVSPTGVKVDYVRTYLPADEGPGKINGTTAFTYTIGTMAEQNPSPSITQQPADLTVANGATATLSVSAISALPLAYQWKFNGVPIPGATTPVLVIKPCTAACVGSYTVSVSTSAGSVLSAPANVRLGSSRLVNLSVRATAGVGGETLIIGFVLGPGATLPVLLRGVGPTLRDFGVNDALADPVIHFFDGKGFELGANDDWGLGANAAALGRAARAVGAFDLSATSRDAALLSDSSQGAYTAQIEGKAGASGVALLEVYDAATDERSAPLINISARAQVGGGAVLIAGFVLRGNVTKQLMIRGIGPALSRFGVTGAVADPQLTLFRDGVAVPLQQNDNWLAAPNAGQVAMAADQVGAFALSANSRDAVLLTTLEPGAYTAQVSGVGGASGVALVEIYEVP